MLCQILSRQYLYLGNVFQKKTMMMMMSCVPHLHLQAIKLLPELSYILWLSALKSMALAHEIKWILLLDYFRYV